MKKMFEELESRVNLLLERNKNLQLEASSLKEENVKLQESVLKEHDSLSELSKEKDEIKLAIESLLKNIDKLEQTNG